MWGCLDGDGGFVRACVHTACVDHHVRDYEYSYKSFPNLKWNNDKNTFAIILHCNDDISSGSLIKCTPHGVCFCRFSFICNIRDVYQAKSYFIMYNKAGKGITRIISHKTNTRIRCFRNMRRKC